MKTQTDSTTILNNFSKSLLRKRQTHHCTSALKTESIEFLEELIAFLFPHFSLKSYYSEEDVLAKLQLLERNLITIIKQLDSGYDKDASKR